MLHSNAGAYWTLCVQSGACKTGLLRTDAVDKEAGELSVLDELGPLRLHAFVVNVD